MRLPIAGENHNGTPTQNFSFAIRLARSQTNAGKSADHAFPCVEAFWRFAPTADVLCRIKLWLDRGDYTFGNLVLDCEDVVEIAVVALGPKMIASRSIDKLSRNPKAVAALSDRAFEHVADAKLASHLLHIDCAPFVGEARIPCDNEKPVKFRKCCNDFLDHSVREILLVGVTAHVLERQDRDRRLIGQGEHRCGVGWRWAARVIIGGEPNAVDAHRTRDVLEGLLAQIIEHEVEPPASILLNTCRHAN